MVELFGSTTKTPAEREAIAPLALDCTPPVRSCFPAQSRRTPGWNHRPNYDISFRVARWALGGSGNGP